MFSVLYRELLAVDCRPMRCRQI